MLDGFVHEPTLFIKSAPLVFGSINSLLVLKRSWKKRLIDRSIKKIKEKKEDEFNRWCDREKIGKMTKKFEKNWKVNLVFLESEFC